MYNKNVKGMKFEFFLVFLILVFGFVLRLVGIKYGLPDLSHPDESRVILDTLSMGNRLSLLPARPDYSLLYRYLLLGLYGFYFIIGKLIGIFKNVNDFAFKFMVDPTNIYIISRMVSVIFGTLTGLLAYLLCEKFFSKAVAFVALLFVLFQFQLVQHAQWAIYPAAFIFTVLLAFYFMFNAVNQPSLKNFVLMGATAGLSISTQNHGIFLLPSLLSVVIFHWLENRNKLGFRILLKHYVFLLVSLFAFSLLGNFYWLFIFKKAAFKYAELLGVTRVGFASQAPYANNILSMVFWFLCELIRQEQLLGIILVAGIIHSVYKHTKFDILILMYLLTNLFVLSNWGFRLLHDMIGVMPVVCILAARFIVDLAKNLKFSNYFPYLFAGILVFPSINESIVVNIKKNNPDTRQLAKAWIENNISVNDKIAIDWHVFSVPLYNEIPLYFRNPVAKKYYDENIPSNIKEKYMDFLKNKKVYNIVEAMQPLDKPLWPEDMPLDAKNEAAKHEVYKDLYSKFHFRKLQELKADNVKYVVISSYIYGYFLLNSDSRKKNVFNPYVKDRVWINYCQADHYIDDKRYGLLYFLSRDARNFYLPLINNELKDVVLIKEFRPNNFDFGPVIKIYKINE